jgi:hypothetical protein
LRLLRGPRARGQGGAAAARRVSGVNWRVAWCLTWRLTVRKQELLPCSVFVGMAILLRPEMATRDGPQRARTFVLCLMAQACTRCRTYGSLGASVAGALTSWRAT